VDSYLKLGYVPAPQCIFAGIEKLPPATLLIVEDGRLTRKRYWHVPARSIRAPSEQDWIGAVRARMEESVRMQMVSDVPIGAFLSGGSIPAASSHSWLRTAIVPSRPIPSVSKAVRPRIFTTNCHNARRVAEQFHTDHHEIVVRPTSCRCCRACSGTWTSPLRHGFITTYLVSSSPQGRDCDSFRCRRRRTLRRYRGYLGNHYQAHFNRLPAGSGGRCALGERLPGDRHSPLLNMLRLAKGFLASADAALR